MVYEYTNEQVYTVSTVSKKPGNMLASYSYHSISPIIFKTDTGKLSPMMTNYLDGLVSEVKYPYSDLSFSSDLSILLIDLLMLTFFQCRHYPTKWGSLEIT